jgi:hypothetical protein
LCSLCGGVVLIFVASGGKKLWLKRVLLLAAASEAAHRKWLASARSSFERELEYSRE